MVNSESEILVVPISALQHYSYCPRQCALIHQEQSFSDNEFTLKGHRAHRRVDSGVISVEAGVRCVRSLPLASESLGLVGKADVVELLEDGTPYPVEYKHGRRQKKEHDDIQLGAQALCLEEMTGKPVPEGAIYHHTSHRRRIVSITAELKHRVIRIIELTRCLIASSKMPPPTSDLSLCRACSLKEICQPKLLRSQLIISEVKENLFRIEDDSK